jgi:hypothetical protein
MLFYFQNLNLNFPPFSANTDADTASEDDVPAQHLPQTSSSDAIPPNRELSSEELPQQYECLVERDVQRRRGQISHGSVPGNVKKNTINFQ